MKIYAEDKDPSLQSLGKLGKCNLFMVRDLIWIKSYSIKRAILIQF